MLLKNTRENNENEEVRPNRLRTLPTSVETVETRDSLTTPTEIAVASVRARQKSSRVSPKLSPQKKSWLSENITDNPMYQKELLAGRRAFDLKTPMQRFWSRAIPLGALGGVYYSIYYTISWYYQEAYNRFIAAVDPKSAYHYLTQRPHASPTKYAMEESIMASMVSYCVILVLLFLVTAVGIPLLAARKITAERERMNWNALLMSRLTPSQILIGKMAPILRTVGIVHLTALPALLITALMCSIPVINEVTDPRWSQINNSSTLSDILVWMSRATLLSPLTILATALLNTTIATYFSLIKKKSLEANQGTIRAITMPLIVPLGITGLCYALPNIISLVQNKMQQSTLNFPAWIHPLFFAPNIFNPMGALIASLFPGVFLRYSYDSTGPISAPLEYQIWAFLVAIAPFVYLATTLGLTHTLWKKMLRVFENAPKDASG